MPVALPRRLALAATAALLAGCVSQQRYDALQSLYDQMRTQLDGEIAADQATISKQQGELKVTLKAEILFPEGGYTLSPKAKDTLDKILPALQGLQNTKIVVRGYTDNLPIGPALAARGIVDNLELSSRRADNVVTYLNNQGVNPNLLSAQGFGDTNPVAPNDSPANRAKNRRIELVLTGPGT